MYDFKDKTVATAGCQNIVQTSIEYHLVNLKIGFTLCFETILPEIDLETICFIVSHRP